MGTETLRIAEPDDAPAIAAIYAPIVERTTISFELTPPSVEEMRQRIQTKLKTHTWLVSLDESRKVDGYAYGSQLRDRPAYQWSVEVTLYVRADRQRKGVGKKLYGALLPALARKGFCEAFAGVALPNAGSIALHKSFGFEPVGVYRNVGYKQGTWCDVSWWQKSLRPRGQPRPLSNPGGDLSF